VVQRAAAITSPVFHRISSNRVTPAGLTGYSERAGAHRSRVIPGKLALASWGTAAIEDLQHVDTHSRRHTFGILSDMLELGRLIRTTHHDIDIAVETALLADVNPRSTTRPADADRELVFLKDLDLPINFLSRLDLIVLFDRNMDRQIKMMHSIVSSIDHVGPEHDLHNDPRARRLRNLLAYLRDTYPEIDVRPAVQLTNEKLTELLTANSEHLKGLDLAADFIVRGAKSLMKLIAASARLHARDTATDDDVRLAFELYECKMKFISKLEPSLEPVKDWKHSIEAKIARQQRMLEHFMGQEVLISAIERMFSGVTRKTLTRDLSAIGARHLGQGVWSIPTNGTAVEGLT
jgi:DNA replicative helicase MCM subunit Mcm2 (Cdc46/Mcm family)